MSNMLAFDTSGDVLSVALQKGADIFSSQQELHHGHAEHILPAIQSCLAQADMSFDDIEAIGTINGPGGFTGLRVGVATAQSLSLALHIPVFGFTAFEVLAQDYCTSHDREEAFAVVIDSRRDDVYVQCFDSQGQAVSEAKLMTIPSLREELENLEISNVIGISAERFQKIIEKSDCNESEFSYIRGFENFTYPNLKVMIGLVVKKLENSKESFSSNYCQNIKPFYLRDADVSQSKKVSRILKN